LCIPHVIGAAKCTKFGKNRQYRQWRFELKSWYCNLTPTSLKSVTRADYRISLTDQSAFFTFKNLNIMATQNGIIKIKGTIGDLTFYRSKDGHLVREKNSVDANRIANDPAFSRTRENGKEFGAACKASKLLRDAIKTILQQCKDSRVTSRLSKEMLKVIKADITNLRGERNVIDGELELLQGFDFNLNAKLGATFFGRYIPEINRVTGDISFTVASFVPSQMVSAPAGATHFKIVSAAAEINFANKEYFNEQASTLPLPLNEIPTGIITQVHNLNANSTNPLLLLAGIQFMQEVNGTMYPLKNGAYNALNLIKVSGV
jgi:hypothetical protein